jgi:predicted nucleic acid-binding protein
MPEYIFNTTALSNFAAINRSELLETRYKGRAFTTAEVSNELRQGINGGYVYLKSVWQQIIDPAGWLRILTPQTAEEYRLKTEFDNRLDSGEASCLTLAVSRRFIFVTDDLAARRLAAAKSVRLTGTLGILIGLIRDNVLPLHEANSILTGMIRQGYRSPADCLDDFV